MLMPAWGSFSFLFGPLVALLGVLALVGLARWSMTPGRSLVARPGRPDQYGMLVPVASARSMREAETLRDRLAAAGVRCSIASTVEGIRLLAWPQDADRARDVLGGIQPPDDRA